MNLLFFVLAMLADPATCPMHAQHMAQAASTEAHAHEVDARGDDVMGFSHTTTRHTFRLYADGGAIEVRANEAGDAATIQQIRTHLQSIAQSFTKGEFESPEAIHGRVPDGVPAMKSAGSAIRYVYEDIEAGGRVRIATRGEALAPVHAFLRFQIEDHRTGDSGVVEPSPAAKR